MKKLIAVIIIITLTFFTSEITISQQLITNATIANLYSKYNISNSNTLFNLTNISLINADNKDYTIISKIDTSKSIKKNKIYKVNPWKLTALSVAGIGVFTGLHIYYKTTWWKDQRKYFKYAEDGYYARNIDKLSHIYTANFFTELTAVAYEWTGINPNKALIYGAITSLAYETYIEINDGFAPNWGFDWGDVGGNIFGVMYPFIQKHVPVMQNFTFKWSFKPKWLKGKVDNADDLLDDYTNMTFWLGISPKGLLPKKLAEYYPAFLGIAIGMSIKNASHVQGSTNAYTEWYLSLDYDLTKLPGKTDFLKKLKKILNFYHFPAPAVRISPSGIWYGLYF